MNKVIRVPERTSAVSTFGSLVSRRVLIPSDRTNLVAVDKYFLVGLAKGEIGKIEVDEDFYFAKYPDIKSAVEAGKIAGARQHYVSDGYYEHRLPYEIIVDEKWYLAQYPDVKTAVESGSFDSAQIHFETAGYREGREPYAGFELISAN